ncbi:hypothetical protein AE938_04875 [Bacteroides fragilis]|uniref:restriction endonuclease subunit S n=1 Tax=Bacteroides fragilis TaxID=817 RepID=UPI001CA7B958|nr:restriction endonuclease subunit S [Bacteroides fragilis]MBY2898204.1 hypothetical protein [Bacteroides fragilis]
MSYLDKLLDGVEVEWKTLGDEDFVEIANSGRRPVKASERISGNIPYYGANNIQDYVDGFTHDGKYVLIAEDGTASLENYSIQWATGKFWANNHVHVLRGIGSLNSRFLFHYLRIVNFIPFLSGGGRAKLTKGKLIEISIPIPPIEIQKEIVRILDKFSTLTAELTAELTARKSQYEYYRNQLLTYPMEEFDQSLLRLNRSATSIQNSDNSVQPLSILNLHTGNSVLQPQGKRVEWKTLGEVGEIGTGSHDTQDAVENGNYIFYARGREPLRLNVFDFDEIAIITAGDGVGVGKVFHYAQGKYALHQRAYRIVPGKRVNPRFMYHYISAHFYAYVQKTSVSSSVTSLRKPMLLKFPIPIPYPNDIEKSLKEQERIASILDKFDTLTTSITEGLPKEIELRQKQYAYYRDMLLTFPNDNLKA